MRSLAPDGPLLLAVVLGACNAGGSRPPPGPVIATVQRRPAAGSTSLVPALDIGRFDADTNAVADAAIERSIRQVRRFYPDAAATPGSQLSRVARRRDAERTWHHLIDGEQRPVRVQVDVVCCTAAHELVEYHFRHAPDVNVDRQTSAFLREFPWTEAEAAR